MAMNRLLLCLLLCVAASARPAEVPLPSQLDTVRVDDKTEAVLKGALKWLSAKQSPNGEWASSDEEKKHPIAITAYALIAFLACGQLPGEGEHARTVSAGVQYLLDKVQPEGYIGDHNNERYMYNHGIACIALSEIYGQTKSASMRPKLERAIKLIIVSQSKDGVHAGGWRYKAVPKDADISVTVLQVVALRSAKNAGIDVPQKTLDDAVKYVKSCYLPGAGGFVYQPKPKAEAGFARTAAAIYSLQVCGLYDDPLVQKGSEYLMREFTDRQTDAKDGPMHFWTYGNFYAAPAQYMRGGETWTKWYGMVKRPLLATVITRGDESYWEQPVGDRPVGPVWCTAIYTMILAMPYHYLPLYQR